MNKHAHTLRIFNRNRHNAVPRVAVVRVFRADGWPSMDLCADQLLTHLPAAVEQQLDPVDVAPPFRHRVTRLPVIGSRKAATNADRLLNRQFDLPRILRSQRHDFDLFHVVDHSYAAVVHALPAGQTGVYCHDLDAFRCLIDPAADPRPWWFRRMARRILNGLQKAAVVFHNSWVVRQQILQHQIISEDRLVWAPLGVSAEFCTGVVEKPADQEPFLLHVGGNIPRKRLDVLLDCFAGVHKHIPNCRLVQVGGPWPAEYAERIRHLGIGDAVRQVRGLDRPALADLYRRAKAVLVTSEAEGFGLPVIEALACGTRVVASDIPVLREVGGSVVAFCPVGDIPAWVSSVCQALTTVDSSETVAERTAAVARYTWHEHARTIGNAYLKLLAR